MSSYEDETGVKLIYYYYYYYYYYWSRGLSPGRQDIVSHLQYESRHDKKRRWRRWNLKSYIGVQKEQQSAVIPNTPIHNRLWGMYIVCLVVTSVVLGSADIRIGMSLPSMRSLPLPAAVLFLLLADNDGFLASGWWLINHQSFGYARRPGSISDLCDQSRG